MTLIQKRLDFFNKSPLRKFGQDSLIAACLSLVAKILGFIKELMVAAYFGLSGSMDVYFVAFILICFPLSIIITSIQITLISFLSSAKISFLDGNKIYFLTTIFALALLAVILPIWLYFIPKALPWIASGFAPAKRLELETALFWMVPYYFLFGFNLLSYGVLQARGQIILNGLLPIFTPISFILIFLISNANGDWHIPVFSLVVGMLLETIGLITALCYTKQITIPKLSDIPKIKQIINSGLVLIPGTFMLALGPLIEQAIAASMTEGTNAALGYGFKLPAAFQGIFVTALSITVLPYFSRQLGENQAEYCLHSLNKLTKWLIIGGGLVFFPLSLFSEDIVSLLYQRGSFDIAATSRVAPIQLAYFVQLPFALVVMLGLKTLIAIGRNDIISIYSIISILIQSFLAYLLGIRYGAIGIAWAATSVSALLAAIYFFNARLGLKNLIKNKHTC